MGSEFTFQDFVDDRGKNVIHDWLDDQIPVGAKAKFDKWILHLEATPHGDWKRPLVDTLDGHCAGLFEIRVEWDNQQYRLLGAHNAERKPVLLHGFIKPDDRVDQGECDRALARKAQVESGAKVRRVRHNYE